MSPGGVSRREDGAPARGEESSPAGPANSSAAAAPAGAPAVSKPSASGTSKKVGGAIGIAIKAVVAMMTTFADDEVNVAAGTYSLIAIPSDNATTSIGMVRPAT